MLEVDYITKIDVNFQESYKKLAILINSGTDTTVNAFMIIAMVIGFFQIRHLDFVPSKAMKEDTDTIMIITGYFWSLLVIIRYQ